MCTLRQLAGSYLAALEWGEREVTIHVENSIGFPSDRTPLVKDIVRGHMFYADPAPQIEAVISHDVDVLDFMGAIGVARLLSIVGLDHWTPDLKSAIELIQRFSQELPGKLHTPQARQMGKVRRAEMEAFLTSLSDETHNFNVL